MVAKILVVDDEKDIVEFIQYNLKQEGFEVITAYSGVKALDLLNEKPDLILLDVMMPELDGYEVCKKIKRKKKYKTIPIIFLTAKLSEENEIRGLELGADDYIPKPVSIKKLIARIKANLRQSNISSKKESSKIIEAGPIKIDWGKHFVYVNNKELFFPKKEFEIISFLVSRPNQVIPREELLKSIWGEDVFVVDRTIDVHIRKIREKLGNYSKLIETVKGVGYRFSSNQK